MIRIITTTKNRTGNLIRYENKGHYDVTYARKNETITI